MRSEPNWQAVALTALVIAIVLLCVWMLWRFLPALAWAAVLAIATWPLRERLAGRRTEATAAAAVLTLGLTLALIVPLAVVGVQIAREATQIVHWVKDLRESGIPTPDWIAQLPYVGAVAADWWQTHLADAESAKALLGRAEAVGIVHWTQLGSQLVGRLVILLFTLLTLFFLYRDGPRLMTQSRRIAGRLFGPAAKKIGVDAVNAVRGTVNGLVLVGLAEGLIMGLAYVIAGVTHPVLFGFATAVLATVPFGAPLIFIIASLTLVAASQVLAGVLILVFGSVVVFVADHFVRPVLIGNATRLPFLWVLLGIFGGLETFGLVGLFFGPAIISVLLSVWRDAIELSQPEDGNAD